MGILESAISWVSPERALKRAEARTKLSVLNSYKQGVPTRTSETFSKSQGFRFESESDRQQIIGTRDRAYAAYDNDPVARTLVQTETDHVIGDGLNYEPTSDSEAWNREAEDRYYAWLEECSVRGPDVEPGCEIQRNLWAYSRVAGHIGWILVSRGPESRIQTVRAENIVTPDDKTTDPSVYDGVRYDSFGRPAAFYVLTADDRMGTRKFEEIQSRDFVWLPHMTKPGQATPPSCYTTIFDYLANLNRYVDGVGLAAWMATVFGIIFKEPNSAKQVMGLPTLTNSQGNAQRAITMENGSVKYIAPEGEVVQVDAKQPMQQTPEFIRTMFRMIGQPFDMPLEVIAKDMSTCNFASARIGLLPFYRTCRVKAARFGSRWSRTIRWWLSRENYRADDDPKKWKTKFPANYWNHELSLNAFEYTDPVSEAQADLLQRDMGTKSTPGIIAERGRNAAKILREQIEWDQKIESADLPQVHSTMTRDPAPESVPSAIPDPNQQQDTTNAYGN